MTTNPQNIPRAIAALVAALALPLTASAAITDSAHDFSNATTWNAGGEICQPCHTPHNDNGLAGAPLWNHDASTTASYTLYSSPLGTLDATMAQPSGTSKLCLSCHDGAIALDSYGGAVTPTTVKMTGTALVGTTLANDHPVSFTYDAALVTADGGLRAVTDPLVSPLLIGGKVECASCHDPHNDAGIANLLVKSNANSALCLSCHNK